MNWELLHFQAGFRKGRGTSHQIANIRWSIEKAREFQKNIYLCLIDYVKAFVWITTNWKILQEMGIPDVTCLLRNLYAGQEVTEPDMEQQTDSKLGKEYVKAVFPLGNHEFVFCICDSNKFTCTTFLDSTY